MAESLWCSRTDSLDGWDPVSGGIVSILFNQKWHPSNDPPPTRATHTPPGVLFQPFCKITTLLVDRRIIFVRVVFQIFVIYLSRASWLYSAELLCECGLSNWELFALWSFTLWINTQLTNSRWCNDWHYAAVNKFAQSSPLQTQLSFSLLDYSGEGKHEDGVPSGLQMSFGIFFLWQGILNHKIKYLYFLL